MQISKTEIALKDADAFLKAGNPICSFTKQSLATAKEECSIINNSYAEAEKRIE